MGRCEHAVWRPLPETNSQARIEPTTVIWHTAVDSVQATSLWPYFARSDVTVETHFWVRFDGYAEQYIDTNVRADGNYKAGAYAISIEFEDDGDPGRPMTTQQLRKGIDITRWCGKNHAVPMRKCSSPTSGGVGWHAMWGAPSEWTNVRGKTCPGLVRIKQIQDYVLPQLAGGEDIPMTPIERVALWEAWVKGLYAEIGQRPDKAGVDHWVGLFFKGYTYGDVRNAFMAVAA